MDEWDLLLMARSDSSGARVARWRGLLGLVWQRLIGRASTGLFNRVTVTVVVVAIAVALLILVTGVSFSLASQSTVQSNDVDYWVVPESADTMTTVVSVQGPQLGNVHGTNEELRAIDGVTASTPVLIDVVRLRAPDSEEPEFVLGMGIIPGEGPSRIGGLSTGELESGDPHYGSGNHDGPVTGEVILSPAAAELLNASAGDGVVVGSPTTGEVTYSDYSVRAVSDSEAQALGGNFPIAIFHLSELQSLSGAATGDQANQFLVQTNSPGVRSEIQRVYPEATVISRGGLNPEPVFNSDLPLAISASSLLIAIVIGTLFVATTMGLEVESDREFLAVLTAIGIPSRDRLLIVAVTTVSLASVGSIVGIIFATVGAVILNEIVTTQFGLPTVIRLHPLLAVYGAGVGVIMGVFAVPYPLLVAWETAPSEELSG